MEHYRYGESGAVEVQRHLTPLPRSIYEWASRLGSRARTREGAIRAIMAHIRTIQPRRGTPAARTRLETAEWLPALTVLQLRTISATRAAWYRWYRVARCLRHGRYEVLDARDIPHRTTFFGRAEGAAQARQVYVVPGHLRPMIFGHGCGFRWRGRWKHARGSYERATWVGVCGQQTLETYLSAPGRIGHSAALSGECAQYDRSSGVYRRWRWTGTRWMPSGIAVPMPEDLVAGGYGPYEHGRDLETCAAEIARKRQAEAERRAATQGVPVQEVARRLRAARLLARIGRQTMVTAEDVRAAGACGDGIAAWCRTHGVHPSASVSLTDLYRDSVARPYALRIAERIWESHRTALEEIERA